MRVEHPKAKMNLLCGFYGKSRQGWYQHQSDNFQEIALSEMILEKVKETRKDAPRLGCVKLHDIIVKHFKKEKIMGRDAFCNFLRDHGYVVKRRKTRKTTNSHHHFHKHRNLIRNFIPTAPNQLWVSDITYIDTEDSVCYLSLITDAYSRKIIGWALGDTLEAIYSLKALEMALETLDGEADGLIHHSDRGVQYCCHKYVDTLIENQILISMTENGDPLENAIAERINGILKTEWLYQMTLKDQEHSNSEINRIINFYNTQRPHMSINMLTPDQAHKMKGPIKQRWKKRQSTDAVL